MADRANKTMEELIAEAGPVALETYAALGGLHSLLDAPVSGERAIQAGVQQAEFRRESAVQEEQRRARERRKAEMAEEAEERAREAHARNDRAAAEAEAQLMARLRAQYPIMTDTAWNAMWPQVRAQHFMEEQQRRMHAERNNGEVLGPFSGVESF